MFFWFWCSCFGADMDEGEWEEFSEDESIEAEEDLDWDIGKDGPLEGNWSEQTEDEGLFEDGEESVEWSEVEIWD